MIFWPRPRFEWRVRTRSLSLGERTRIVAVVHIGREGVHGGGMQAAGRVKVAVSAAVQAVDAQADIVELVVDVSKGQAPAGLAEEEQGQLLPVLEGLMLARPGAVVAVKVRHAATARAAARLGAEILSEVPGGAGHGGGKEDAMAEAASETGCGLVLRHHRGRSREWLAEGPMSSEEVIPEAFTGLCERMMVAESAGIAAEQLVADPGFGGGRGMMEEMALLAGLGRLRQLGRPLLVGLPLGVATGEGLADVAGKGTGGVGANGMSRDGMSRNGESRNGESRNGESRNGESRNGESRERAQRARAVANCVAAVLAGVHLLRVEDVAAAREAVAVADAVMEASGRE